VLLGLSRTDPLSNGGAISDCIRNLLIEGVRGDQISILALYKGQTSTLQDKIHYALGPEAEQGHRNWVAEAKKVTISTADSFHGSGIYNSGNYRSGCQMTQTYGRMIIHFCMDSSQIQSSRTLRSSQSCQVQAAVHRLTTTSSAVASWVSGRRSFPKPRWPSRFQFPE